MKKMILVDGFSLLFRAYYASVNSRLYDPNEERPSGAIRIFFTQMFRFIKEISPDYVAVVFDFDGKKYRQDKFPDYKGQRKEAPEDFQKQVMPTKELLKLFGIQCIDAMGFEADDYIGTFATNFKEDVKIYLMSGDKDLWQLIDTNVEVIYPGFKDFSYVDVNYFKEKYEGLMPVQLVDLKAIMGDSSDNYPGIKGIGEKGAMELIKKYSTFQSVLDNIEDITKKSVKEKLIEFKSQGELSYFLATIKKDIEHSYNLTDFEPQEQDKIEIFHFTEDYKLFRLREYVELWKVKS